MAAETAPHGAPPAGPDLAAMGLSGRATWVRSVDVRKLLAPVHGHSTAADRVVPGHAAAARISAPETLGDVTSYLQ